MTKEEITYKEQLVEYLDPKTIEALANCEHERWSGWMKYLFTKGTRNIDGTFTIDAGSVKHWQRQIGTSYYDLSEREKESDRKEVLKNIETQIRSELDHENRERDGGDRCSKVLEEIHNFLKLYWGEVAGEPEWDAHSTIEGIERLFPGALNHENQNSK